MDKKTKKAISHILCDYKAILAFMKNCLDNHLAHPSYMGLLPFFFTYVYEGYKYLHENQLINIDCVTKQALDELEEYRAKGVKLHYGFKQSTSNSINKFNEGEYRKFYDQKFPKKEVCYDHSVANYFIHCIDEFPVGNYHLYSKKVFNMEMGSYVSDISVPITNRIYLLTKFSSEIARAIDTHFDINNIATRNIQMTFNYTELNMAYDYSNFRIKGVPPILMAVLDILCVLNSYCKIFTVINENFMFDIKVKYAVLFYSIMSLKGIVEHCEKKQIDIQMDESLKSYIFDLDKKYIINRLRICCMHYDFPIEDWNSDPFIDAFEKDFDNSIEAISQELSLTIDELAEKIQKYLIVKNFSMRQSKV